MFSCSHIPRQENFKKNHCHWLKYSFRSGRNGELFVKVRSSTGQAESFLNRITTRLTPPFTPAYGTVRPDPMSMVMWSCRYPATQKGSRRRSKREITKRGNNEHRGPRKSCSVDQQRRVV